MTNSSSRPYAAVAAIDDEPDVLRPSTCPMCHTSTSLTKAAIEAGGAWQCARCGQHWDAARLAAVTSYAAWALKRDGGGGTP